MFKKRFIKNGRYFFIRKRIPWTPSRGAEGPGVGVAGPEKIDLKTKKLFEWRFIAAQKGLRRWRKEALLPDKEHEQAAI